MRDLETCLAALPRSQKIPAFQEATPIRSFRYSRQLIEVVDLAALC
jgi:hypothetical protein